MSKVKTTESAPVNAGVVLLAFGKQGYYMAAANLATSIIAHSTEVKITVFTDNEVSFRKVISYRQQNFHKVIECKELDRKDPAKGKLSLYNLIKANGYDHNLYIDVDSICLKDINPLIEQLISGNSEYNILVNATYKKGEDMPQMIWGKNDVIWQHFKLKDDAILPATNTSFQYIRKSKLCRALFTLALKEYEKKAPLQAKEMWGNTHPDELYLNVALAKMEMTNGIEGVMFAPFKSVKPIIEVKKEYYFLTFFGQSKFIPSLYRIFYDSQMVNLHKAKGTQHHFHLSLIYQSKHVQ